MEKDKIIVEELEEQTEPKQEEKKAELSVQSFKPSEIGGVFFTESGLTIFPKGFMEQFAVVDPNGGLIGKQSAYDYSKLAGAFERVVTLEKENHDLKDKVAKLESKMAEPDEDKEKEKEKPVEEKPEDEKDKDKDEEKDKVKAEEKEEEKKEEKETAVAKSVEAEKETTKEEAEHSGVDDDIKRVMGSMKKAREGGSL